MIYKLILKDIDAYKITIFVKILLLWLTCSTLTLLRFESFEVYTMHAAMTIIFAASVFSFMEKSHDTEILAGSLPVSRLEIVAARYLTSIIIMLSGIIIWLLLAFAGDFIYSESGTGFFYINMSNVLVLILFAVLIHTSIFLPAVFQFSTIGLTIIFGLAFICSILSTVYIFEPRFSLFDQYDVINDILQNITPVIIAVFSLFISFALSVFIYKRKNI